MDGVWKVKGTGLLLAAAAAKLVLELFHAAGGVDETLLTGESRVGTAGDVTDDNVILDAVDSFLVAALDGRAGQKLVARFNVDKGDGMVSRMQVFLHGKSGVSPGAP